MIEGQLTSNDCVFSDRLTLSGWAQAANISGGAITKLTLDDAMDVFVDNATLGLINGVTDNTVRLTKVEVNGNIFLDGKELSGLFFSESKFFGEKIRLDSFEYIDWSENELFGSQLRMTDNNVIYAYDSSYFGSDIRITSELEDLDKIISFDRNIFDDSDLIFKDPTSFWMFDNVSTNTTFRTFHQTGVEGGYDLLIERNTGGELDTTNSQPTGCSFSNNNFDLVVKDVCPL